VNKGWRKGRAEASQPFRNLRPATIVRDPLVGSVVVGPVVVVGSVLVSLLADDVVVAI
jgi:hypothetical protein